MKHLPLLILALISPSSGCKSKVTLMDDLRLQYFEGRVEYRKTLGMEEMWEELGVKTELFMRDNQVRMVRQNIASTETTPAYIIYFATSNLRQEFQYLVFRREPTGVIRFLGVAEATSIHKVEPSASLDTSGKSPVLVVKREGGSDRYDLAGVKMKKISEDSVSR